ncbi:hypothetical protein SPRG_00077 [Saprolegnia parasitica CBS 223.65]|uniref:Uncharacterized protein n=1 Tax=Saprolegnia parasitica (strain CBS 223.65) TaxID=695850 RepID=A0A067D8B0_SAPPC|nr:hypothetical protein SPRG_00077 [Saprolegnia parasitica CBS 223.65]KDO35232.1 hypothetical protein SPRG_00077 [Saprolegnia parasitica CBS 223.65]|eukprot:XP_012193583.1 hypothetical protein SPRG_00077 [Saprolegnia parasitica CBS 223.65]
MTKRLASTALPPSVFAPSLATLHARVQEKRRRVSIFGVRNGNKILTVCPIPSFTASRPTMMAAPIARWLASGHAVRLKLGGFEGLGLAQAIERSPTLSHLVLDNSSAITTRFVATGRALPHITHLKYY